MSRRPRQRASLPLLAGLLLGLVAVRHCRPPAGPPPAARTDLTLSANDRILILAPHPDDEVLCCGGVIQQAVQLGAPVQVVFLTYGDNNQWSFLVYRKHPVLLPKAMQRMGLVRHDEAVAAARILGLAPDRLLFLGYPDYGTLQLWTAHWADAAPFRSMLTHVTAVPYENARRPGARYLGDEVLRDLTAILREFRPTKVFVSHPADLMPDHAALYLFTRVALWDLEQELRPSLYPYLVHFAHWPSPRGFQPARPLEPPARLQEQAAWQRLRLTRGAVDRKRQALAAHRTQFGTSAAYLLTFARAEELFGDFPPIALRASASFPVILASADTEGAGAQEQLTDEEQARFVGLESRRIAIEGDRLVMTVAYSRPLAGAVGLSIYVFGYRPDLPFSRMPKVHVRAGALAQGVWDQRRRLSDAGITIARQPTQITIRIPLKALGDPRRILTSARTYLGDLPLDWTAWRIVELPEAR